jgi:hypothetical protein
MESSNVRFPCSPGNRRPSLRVGIVPTSKNYRCALRRLKEDSWLSPSNAKGTFSHPCLRVGQKQAGAAGGICSRSAEMQSSSYRYHVTMVPRIARVPRAPCTILHDGITGSAVSGRWVRIFRDGQRADEIPPAAIHRSSRYAASALATAWPPSSTAAWSDSSH